MLLHRIILMGSTIIILIVFLGLGLNYPISAGLTAIIVMGVYFTLSVWRSKKRINLLDEECDPEAFLQRTEKQAKIIEKNPKLAEYIAISLSAGLMCKGEFNRAKDILLDIDEEKILKNRTIMLAYTINLIICCYELGDIMQAERLFETQIALLQPLGKRQQQYIKLLIGGRYFYLGKYEESYEYFMQLLKDKTNYSKREYLYILYSLAQIEEIKGNSEAAKLKYKRIAAKGNKLWIAIQSAERLSKMMGMNS